MKKREMGNLRQRERERNKNRVNKPEDERIKKRIKGKVMEKRRKGFFLNSKIV